MEKEEKLKEMVKQKYSEIALQDKATNQSSCCGAGGCSTEVYNIMSDDYTPMKGYNPDADLGLGCGLPTQFAKIKKGDTVIDLGSGAGNDCFIARAEAGETGKIFGIDFTPAMIEKANANAKKLGFNNVEFRQGDIENMPLAGNVADVVISNCVLNLVPNKFNVFKEILRVLKAGGHFSISDVVLKGNLPATLKKDAEMYAGCVSGAVQKEVYLELIKANGFKNIVIQKEKPIIIPYDILNKYLNEEEITNFNSGDTGILSITVYAEKAGDVCLHYKLLQMKKNILFVCVENSNRSQMAQAFAIIHGQDLVNAASAGSNPSGKINAKAIKAMQELGYDLSKHTSKPLTALPDIVYDYVITMGCGDNCPFVVANRREDWDLPDPRDMDEIEFRKIRDDIEKRVITLVEKIKG